MGWGTIRIAGTVNDSIVDGPGLRYVVFVQGCSHHCLGCHNPETWDFDGGNEVDISDLVSEMAKNPLLSGLTLSGGEPFEQPEASKWLALFAKLQDKNVWCYTGYTWEEIRAENIKEWNNLLLAIDVLVDGPFIQEQKSFDLDYRGSWNQRLIDVKKSLDKGEVVLWAPEKW